MDRLCVYILSFALYRHQNLDLECMEGLRQTACSGAHQLQRWFYLEGALCNSSLNFLMNIDTARPVPPSSPTLFVTRRKVVHFLPRCLKRIRLDPIPPPDDHASPSSSQSFGIFEHLSNLLIKPKHLHGYWGFRQTTTTCRERNATGFGEYTVALHRQPLTTPERLA